MSIRWPAWRSRPTTWIALIESPPSSKKRSCRPKPLRPSTSRQVCATSASSGPSATSPSSAAAAVGGGKAAWSSLPFGSSGRASSITQCAGIM